MSMAPLTLPKDGTALTGRLEPLENKDENGRDGLGRDFPMAKHVDFLLGGCRNRCFGCGSVRTTAAEAGGRMHGRREETYEAVRSWVK